MKTRVTTIVYTEKKNALELYKQKQSHTHTHTHTNDCTPRRDCSPLQVKKANGNLTTKESEAVMWSAPWNDLHIWAVALAHRVKNVFFFLKTPRWNICFRVTFIKWYWPQSNESEARILFWSITATYNSVLGPQVEQLVAETWRGVLRRPD